MLSRVVVRAIGGRIMSEYRINGPDRPTWCPWTVIRVQPPGEQWDRFAVYCPRKVDAERIARALKLLDEREHARYPDCPCKERSCQP